VKVQEIKTPVGDEGHTKHDYRQISFGRSNYKKIISNSFSNKTSRIKLSGIIV
jgi:hypothetical protein